jgi:hypothetical protein
VAQRVMNWLVFGRWPVHTPTMLNEAFIFSSVPRSRCRYRSSIWAKIFPFQILFISLFIHWLRYWQRCYINQTKNTFHLDSF